MAPVEEPMVPLRDLLESNFAAIRGHAASIDAQLGRMIERLEGVELRVAATNGQLISHRMRLEHLESKMNDPAVMPLATLSNGRFVAKVSVGVATIVGVLWSAYWAITKWVGTMAAAVR